MTDRSGNETRPSGSPLLDFIVSEYLVGVDHPADAEAARLARALEALDG